MDSWRSSRRLFALTTGPGLFWLLVFFLVPMAFAWVLGFSEKRGLIDIELTWTFDNYLRAIEPLYLGILWQSIWIAAVTTVICLVIGFPVALAISFAKGPMKTLLLLAVILPFWTNLLIRTYALIAILRTNGTINFTLEWFWTRAADLIRLIGMDPTPILGPWYEPVDLLYNHGSVIFGLVYVHLPFMILPLYAALERLDRSYMEASLDLGAKQSTTFLRVVVPLALPGIISGIVITFVPAMGTFLTPNLLGGPDTAMIGNVIEQQFKSANDWPFGAAMSFLLMYITFAILALRALMEGQRAKRGMREHG